MGCNSATKVGMIEIRFPGNIYFESQLYSFQAYTCVVGLLFTFWTRPHSWFGSFFHFQQNHRCGQPPIFDLTKTTDVGNCCIFLFWLFTDTMNFSHRINSPLYI